jgi:hypothetical protein
MAGQPFYQRKLAAEVRNLTLNEIKEILLDKECKKHEKSFRQQVILKLSTNVLPRLNEHTGADGKDLNLGFDGIFKTTQSTEKDSSESK